MVINFLKIFHPQLCYFSHNVSGLKKTEMSDTDMHVARQTAFYCYFLNTTSLPEIQFTFHRENMKQKFLICEDCVIMVSKGFCFSRDEKSSYSNEERFQLVELVEQFKKKHLKEKEALEGKTRYAKKRKNHVPDVTHVNFVAKAVRKFYSDLLGKPNDDPQFRVAHNLAPRCLANINKLHDPSIYQPKKARAAGAGRMSKALNFGKSSLPGLLTFEKN